MPYINNAFCKKYNNAYSQSSSSMGSQAGIKNAVFDLQLVETEKPSDSQDQLYICWKKKARVSSNPCFTRVNCIFYLSKQQQFEKWYTASWSIKFESLHWKTLYDSVYQEA